MRRETMGALAGVIFIALVIVGAAIGGEPPDVESPVAEIVDHYTDNKDAIVVGIILGGLGLIAFLVYANHLRKLFAAAGDAPLSALVLVGASIMAIAFAIDATILLALAESVDDIEPDAVQALQALWDNDFVPIALGVVTFLGSAGLSVLHTGALPKWLGWAALVLVVVGFTPAGFVAFLGGGVWILITSILLTVRTRREPPPATPATG